jgi:hypothetical protein
MMFSMKSISTLNATLVLRKLGVYVAAVIAKLRDLAPYVVIELVLPGGSLMALVLWLYRQKRRDRPGSPLDRLGSHGVRLADDTGVLRVDRHVRQEKSCVSKLFPPPACKEMHRALCNRARELLSGDEVNLLAHRASRVTCVFREGVRRNC